MSSAREQEIFASALELSNAVERGAWVDRACAGDPGLRERVEELLVAHDGAETFFAECTGAIASAAEGLLEAESAEETVDEFAGSWIGPYELVEKIGEGGCGAVYLAEQRKPVRRRVALKIIKLGMDTRSVIARFEAERQALAMMEHPNIARVLDAGATETGRPFFVMELVGGTRITDYCDANRLTISQRLGLFIQVCQAIQHAHQKGIIHRDIKPSNILVTTVDGVPLPKVIDFGIAKAIEEKLTGATQITACGHFIGTPAYMSPEQAQLNASDGDTRSDLYSLGVLLYELLTGRTPFDQRELLASGVDEMRRILCEREPPRPSARLEKLTPAEFAIIAEQRRAEPAKLRADVRGDLDWIATKALEKDRNRRYQTARELAKDVERFLGNEAVLARPPSVVYRCGKALRRNRLAFTAIGAVSLTVLLGFGVSTWLYLRERQAFQLADRLRLEAEARQKLTQATLLASRDRLEEAAALVAGIAAPDPNLEYADLYRRLGNWNVAHNRWTQAAKCFAVLGEISQPEKWDTASLDYLRCGPALIEAGDRAGYDRFRAAAIRRYTHTTDPVSAERVIKTSLLLPADAQMLRSMEPLWHVATKPDEVSSVDEMQHPGIATAWRLFSLALLEYRRGNHEGALRLCERAAGNKREIPAQIANLSVVRGLAYRALGRNEQAEAEFTRARELLKGAGNYWETDYWFDWVFPLILLREAEETADPGNH